jgi:cysteinyl-tRNA synthetase
MYYFYNTINAINKFLAQNTEMKEVANEVADNIEAKFREAMDDDFNTPVAVAELFADFKYVNNLLKDGKVPADEKAYILNKIKAEIVRCYNVIGLFKEDVQGLIDDLKNKYVNKLGLDITEVENKIQERTTAKAEKNYEVADKIRSELDEQGIILNDSKEGTTWDIKELYNL